MLLNFVVIHREISNYRMIFAVIHVTVPKFRHSTREVRHYKNFVETEFIEDIASPLGHCMSI